MTIKNRLLLSFTIIVITLMGFGYYQNSVYNTISSLSTSTGHITNVNNSLQIIEGAQAALLRTNMRTHVTTIFDEIGRVRNKTQNISSLGLTRDMQAALLNVESIFDDYEVLFKKFVSTNDQYHALKSEVDTNNHQLIAMLESSVAKYKLEDYTECKSLVISLITLTSNETNETDNNEQLNGLSLLADDLSANTNPFEIRLLGERLKHQYTTRLENFELLNKLEDSNQQISIELNTKIVNLTGLMNNIFSLQSNYSSQILRNLKQTYIMIFTSILVFIIVVLFNLSNRITKSFNSLLKGTELISKGEYAINLKLSGNDEFNELTKSINTMANSLEYAEQSLKNYSTQLEQMVEEKTKELTIAKNELEIVNETIQQEKNKYAVLAMTDVLTGLKNRVFFMEFLTQRINEATRYQKPFSLMIIDIDYFKLVNDTYGHQVGDIVLKVIASLITERSRTSDLVARYGGEEFMVVFPETDISNALTIAERIRNAVETQTFIQKDLHLTISGGLAEYNGSSETEFLKLVDDLLYQAKSSGRNRIKTVQYIP